MSLRCVAYLGTVVEAANGNRDVGKLFFSCLNLKGNDVIFIQLRKKKSSSLCLDVIELLVGWRPPVTNEYFCLSTYGL